MDRAGISLIYSGKTLVCFRLADMVLFKWIELCFSFNSLEAVESLLTLAALPSFTENHVSCHVRK